MPPSDWMGSRNSAATSSGSTSAARSWSSSLRTAGPASSEDRYGSGYGSCTSPGRAIAGSCDECPETPIEPSVPPW